MDSNALGGEDAALGRLSALLEGSAGKRGPGEVHIGDDAAVLTSLEGALLFATDAVVAGVHLDMAYADLADLGYKAMAVNLSDIAAMGGTPKAAVVSVVTDENADLEVLYRGIAEAAERFACPVVGGDLSNLVAPSSEQESSAPGVVVSIAILGSVPTPVLRSGAHPGDTIFVTGPLGGSAAGLESLRAGASRDDPRCAAHLRPVPRLGEGHAAAEAGATAMMDVSDGLALDLHRLCDASKVGFELDMIPVTNGATREQALDGGEDYELIVVSADAAALLSAFTRKGLREPFSIGRCVADSSLRTLEGAPLERLGWQHSFDDPSSPPIVE